MKKALGSVVPALALVGRSVLNVAKSAVARMRKQPWCSMEDYRG
jgi:hypothetical protein